MKTRIFLLTLTLTALVAATAAAQPPMRHGHHGSGLWESLAADFDHDGNGEITRAEMAGAEETFDRLDRNDDGVLTADEVQGRGRGMRRGFGGILIVRAADGDGDGTITSAELESFLATVDANGDGAVEREEIQAALPDGARGPGMGMHGPGMGHGMGMRGPMGDAPGLALDFDGDGTVETEDLRQIFAELDANGDGEVTSDELPAFRRGGPRMAAGVLIHHADADGDGEVTSAEWQSFVGGIDADGNGTIDESEWLAAAPPPAGHEPPPEHFAMLTRILDRDGDGAFEPSDLDAVFAELDADGDGVVEAGELPGFHHRRGPRGG